MRFINLFLDENTFKNYSHGRMKPPMITKFPSVVNSCNIHILAYDHKIQDFF